MNRLFISAAHKSSGKTTVCIGLCAALRTRGQTVQPFKKGPDYIDPLWLGLAAGRPCYNLDAYLMNAAEIRAEFARRLQGATLAIIEGNKGLYDGLDLDGGNSNAALAKLLGTPVILVIDARGMTRGIAPLILGYQAFDKNIRIAGVILNQLGGSRHEAKLRAVIEHYTDVPVLGAIQHDECLTIVERHLGLIPSNEARAANARIDAIAAGVAAQVDLDRLLAVAATASALPSHAMSDDSPSPSGRGDSGGTLSQASPQVNEITQSVLDSPPSPALAGGETERSQMSSGHLRRRAGARDYRAPRREGMRERAGGREYSENGKKEPSPRPLPRSGRGDSGGTLSQASPASGGRGDSDRTPIMLGVARDAAFGFYYPGDLDALQAAGAELVPFDALRDARLPAVDGLFIGGGFPETHMDALAANRDLRRALYGAIEDGMPVYAECGGLMYLARGIEWNGHKAEMVGVIPADIVMHARPVGRGYVHLRETGRGLWPRPSTGEAPLIHAHEFHYSSVENLPTDVEFAYEVLRGHGIDGRHDGIVYKNLLASYTHLRDVADNHWAARFVDFIRRHKRNRGPLSAAH